MFNRIKSLPHLGAIAVSYGAMLIEGSLMSIMVALMAILATKFGKTAGDIATLLSLKGFGTLLVLFLAGRLSDQFGRKIPIAVGSLLFSIFMLGFIFTTNFYVAGIFAFIAGIAHGLMDTPGMSLLFDALSGNTGPALSLVQVFFASGTVLTTMLTSIFIRYNINYIYVFVIVLVFNTLLFILILNVKYPPLSGKVEVKTYHITYKKEPSFAVEGLFLFVNIMVYASYQGISSTWLPTFLEQTKGFDLATSVSMISLYSIGSVVGALFFAWVLRYHHSSKLMSINPFIAMLVLTALVLSKVNFIVIPAIFFMGFLTSTYFSMSINMGGELFPRQAGTATGAVATASMLGNTSIVWLSGRVVESVGVNNLMIFGIGALFTLTVLSALFRIHYLKLEPERN